MDALSYIIKGSNARALPVIHTPYIVHATDKDRLIISVYKISCENLENRKLPPSRCE
jgi:hypothetical protein